MSKPVEVKNGQPMTETTYFILLSLAPGPGHGYAIMKDVQKLSQGRVSLSTGTLYGALKRLLVLGWIERVDDPAAEENGRERKAYRLTQLGQAALDGEIERLNGLLTAAGQRVAGKPNVLHTNPPQG
jgi:DNA-binding PadR family transcriptional regulator